MSINIKGVVFMVSPVMTVEELADYLKMKVVTIYKHAQEGKLPGFKVGSKWRFKKDTIDEWIKSQEEGGHR
jgi:excisionase family DNA binding protein